MIGLILALIDGGVTVAAAAGALVIWTRPVGPGAISVLAVAAGAAGLSLACLGAFGYAGLYNLRTVRNFEAFLARVPRALAAAGVFAALVCTWIPAARILGDAVASSLLFVVGVVFGPLVPLRAVAYRVMHRRPFTQRLLIVGTGILARELLDEIDARPELQYRILGLVDDGGTSGGPVRHPLLGPVERLIRIVEETRPDRIIVALTQRRGRLPVGQLLEAQVSAGIVVEDGVEVYERLTGKLALESLTPSSLVFSRDFRKSRITRAVARGVTLLASIAGLIGFAPLFGVIALAIKLDSRGPVFFVQERVGMCGRHFTLVKFRTMHPAREPRSEWAQDNGDRITRVGRWLRKYHLDELPQLLNMVRGDMNLVGPRPHPVSNFELFVLVSRNLNDMTGENTPYYSLRCAVRPGLTGWAQVRYGYANDLEEETEKLRYDLYYIKHRSFGLDLRILSETLRTILHSPPEITTAAALADTRRPGLPLWSSHTWAGPDRHTAAFAGVGGSGGPHDSLLDPDPGGR